MGVADRTIRMIIAAILLVFFFTDRLTGTLGIILLAVAGIFVLTSLISWCPLYVLFGLKTRKTVD